MQANCVHQLIGGIQSWEHAVEFQWRVADFGHQTDVTVRTLIRYPYFQATISLCSPLIFALSIFGFLQPCFGHSMLFSKVTWVTDLVLASACFTIGCSWSFNRLRLELCGLKDKCSPASGMD